MKGKYNSADTAAFPASICIPQPGHHTLHPPLHSMLLTPALTCQQLGFFWPYSPLLWPVTTCGHELDALYGMSLFEITIKHSAPPGHKCRQHLGEGPVRLAL